MGGCDGLERTDFKHISELMPAACKIVPLLTMRWVYQWGVMSELKSTRPKLVSTLDHQNASNGGTSELRSTGPHLLLVLPTTSFTIDVAGVQKRVFFSIEFHICDYKSGSLKVPPHAFTIDVLWVTRESFYP